MIRHKSFLEKATMAALPIAGVAMLILAQFVSLGVNKPDINFVWNLVINIAMLICFYIPCRNFGEQKAVNSETVKAAEANYLNETQRIYDNHEMSKLEDWCRAKNKERINRYIEKRVIDYAGITMEQFEEKYKGDNGAVRKDKTLTQHQKKYLKIANKYSKVPLITADKIMPHINKGDDLHDALETYKPAARITSERKLFFGLCMTLCIGLISVNPGVKSNALAICIVILLKLLSGIASSISGLWSGNRLVMVYYVNDITTKTVYLNEFHGGKNPQ